jgi:hypothetical protein
MTHLQQLAALRQDGFCILLNHFPPAAIEAARDAFWPTLHAYLEIHAAEPNRGPNRHFLPMPFDPPCFNPAFFFDPAILALMRAAMDETAVADQWGCDVALPGSQYQEFHIDYRRPLFPETPSLPLPPYMLAVSFGLVPIALANGPIEIGQPVPLALGDVLIRHPWAPHRGTPNTSAHPRPLATIRYVRRWYTDHSRGVNSIPRAVWQSLTPEQQAVLRFPVAP